MASSSFAASAWRSNPNLSIRDRPFKGWRRGCGQLRADPRDGACASGAPGVQDASPRHVAGLDPAQQSAPYGRGDRSVTSAMRSARSRPLAPHRCRAVWLPIGKALVSAVQPSSDALPFASFGGCREHRHREAGTKAWTFYSAWPRLTFLRQVDHGQFPLSLIWVKDAARSSGFLKAPPTRVRSPVGPSPSVRLRPPLSPHPSPRHGQEGLAFHIPGETAL